MKDVKELLIISDRIPVFWTCDEFGDEDLLRWHINQARELKRKLKLDRDLVV